jgi:hypothetical protein
MSMCVMQCVCLFYTIMEYNIKSIKPQKFAYFTITLIFNIVTFQKVFYIQFFSVFGFLYKSIKILSWISLKILKSFCWVTLMKEIYICYLNQLRFYFRSYLCPLHKLNKVIRWEKWMIAIFGWMSQLMFKIIDTIIRNKALK